jgi:fructosamine-3-kinase
MRGWEQLCRDIGRATGEPFAATRIERLGGGCINDAWLLADGRRRFFVKSNHARALPQFEAEQAGLAEIVASASVRVPRPLTAGRSEDTAWLVLEYLPLTAGSRAHGARLGEALANMHRHLGRQFGWIRDNSIGSTPQHNPPTADWVSFWRGQRLGFQLELAACNGHYGLQPEGSRLLEALDQLFAGHQPLPSLLHGDLWGGNAGELETGEPVIFDPAVYYGDREADLAMTELFGGFGADFRAAYAASWPLDPGYTVRRDLYNLYHVLNHLNLFGGGYRSQAECLLRRLLAELA